MKDKYDIKTIYHNRCVVIPAEQLAVAGIDKGDYAILHYIQYPEHGPGSIDFNAITPMPPWAAVNGDAMRECWCMKNWKAPENAGGLTEGVGTYDGGNTIEFDTLGGDVRDLTRKLSMMFPHLDFAVDYLWASEDIGKDSGSVTFKTGEQTYEYIPTPGSDAAYELAFDIFSTDAAAHGLVFDDELGTYRYGGTLLSHGEVRHEQEE